MLNLTLVFSQLGNASKGYHNPQSTKVSLAFSPDGCQLIADSNTGIGLSEI
jgi:hypothetical protein